jgi:uncharacterized protein involved in exopolysaccharide biosynthesis
MNIFDSKNNFEWRDYFRILKRRRWYFILPSLIVMPLGVLKILTTQPLYESACTVQIVPSRLLSATLQRVVPGVGGHERIDALKKEILSSEYLLQLIDRLGLKSDKEVQEQARKMHERMTDKSLEEIVEILLIDELRALILLRQYSYDIVEIRTRAYTAEMSYMMVSSLTDIFIEESLRNEMGYVQSALRFSDEQIAVFKEKLEQAESKLAHYQREMISNEVDSHFLNDESLSRIREAVVTIEITKKEKQDYLNYLSSQLKENDPINNCPESSVIKEIEKSIRKKIDLMAALMERASWRSAEVIKVNRDINDLRNRIRGEFEKVLSSKYTNANRQLLGLYLDKAITLYDLEILESKNQVLNQLLERSRKKAAQNPSNELALTKLQEEVSINRKIYNMFLEQNQGVQIEESVQRADAASRYKILEPPTKPLEPVNAGYRMIVFITLMIGAGLGGATVYLRELFDKSIRTVQEAEESFQIPVVGVLPYLESGRPLMVTGHWRTYLLVVGFLFIAASLFAIYVFTNSP